MVMEGADVVEAIVGIIVYVLCSIMQAFVMCMVLMLACMQWAREFCTVLRCMWESACNTQVRARYARGKGCMEALIGQHHICARTR
jgi:hypothetical protein